ncbi:DNA/RNA non-specific endonuclease [Marinomonas sp. TI.3.20]|uniref:DNA/RNA non-specific endonuclease n=1 Tax=Marinomonas sp. TI.3.20 TaxID=3121296 RepID=UPI00311E91CA
MYEQVEKSKENKNRAVTNSVVQKKNNGKQGFGFVDNRSEYVSQLASSISYNTTEYDLENGKKEIVGKKMDAHLEQSDAIKGSSPGDGVQAGLMGSLKTAHYNRMIRGHLLNGQFGGLGIAMNLYPITAKANSLHKNHVENPIKKHIKEGKDVDYSVEVVNAANKISSPNAEFKCVAIDANNQQTLVDEVVSSIPSKATNSALNGPGIVEGGIANNSPSISFPSKNMKAGWGEVSSGFSINNTEHKNTAEKITLVKVDGKNQNINNLSGDLIEGRSFIKGQIDRREYASELTESYIDEFGKKKLYFDFDPTNGYLPSDLENVIATMPNDKVEIIINRLEGLLEKI